jgi:ATP-dependent helicase/nuclease subunit B
MPASDPWVAVVSATAQWIQAQGLNCRDVIVLLPFAQLLPVAKRAFGATGDWMPRIETTQSLARGLGPAERPAAGQPSFDVALDCIVAARLLRSQSWAASWADSDAPGFAQAVADVVHTTHALALAAFALPSADPTGPVWRKRKAAQPSGAGMGGRCAGARDGCAV